MRTFLLATLTLLASGSAIPAPSRKPPVLPKVRVPVRAPSLDEARRQNFERWTNEAEKRRHEELMAAERRRPPGAPITVQVPVTGTATTPDGRKVTVSTTLSVEISDPLPPPDVPTTLAAVQNSAGASITEATEGDTVSLVGTNLWHASVPFRVLVADRVVSTSTGTSTGTVQFKVPALGATEPVTGSVDLIWFRDNGWQHRGRIERFTIRPRTVARDPQVRFNSFHAEDGSPREVFTIHEPILVRGAGFGDEPGTFFVRGFPWPTLRWSDTEILLKPYDGANRHHRLWLGVRPAGTEPPGAFVSATPTYPFVVMPGEEPVR